MARFHVSESVPTKHEVIGDWACSQPWWRGNRVISRVGSFHFDDPEGEVGMETHLLESDGVVHAVAATYRGQPLEDAQDGLLGTIEHSVLGTRWIYDGMADDRYLALLTATALTGQGPALGLAQHDGRWFAAPSEIALLGGGWGTGYATVDGFAVADRTSATVTALSDHFELSVHRLPASVPRPDMGLTVAWADQPGPVLFAEVRPLND